MSLPLHIQDIEVPAVQSSLFSFRPICFRLFHQKPTFLSLIEYPNHFAQIGDYSLVLLVLFEKGFADIYLKRENNPT